jgi:hypothetical protein
MPIDTPNTENLRLVCRPYRYIWIGVYSTSTAIPEYSCRHHCRHMYHTLKRIEVPVRYKPEVLAALQLEEPARTRRRTCKLVTVR